MGFAIYDHQDSSISRKGSFRLSGEAGALGQHIQKLEGSSCSCAPVSWKMSAEEILTSQGSEPQCWLVFEADAGGDCLALQRVHSVTGLSKSDDTEVILTTEMIEPEGSGGNGWLEISTAGKLYSEALRLTGGTDGGSYKWAPPAMQIGAAHVG